MAAAAEALLPGRYGMRLTAARHVSELETVGVSDGTRCLKSSE